MPLPLSTTFGVDAGQTAVGAIESATVKLQPVFVEEFSEASVAIKVTVTEPRLEQVTATELFVSVGDGQLSVDEPSPRELAARVPFPLPLRKTVGGIAGQFVTGAVLS